MSLEIPKAVTTTSSITIPSDIVTFKEVLPSTAISCVLYPTNEKTKVPLASESIEYLPSPLVTVPEEVPLTLTLTPGNPEPSLSETTPETDWDCPYTKVHAPIIKIVNNDFIISMIVC